MFAMSEIKDIFLSHCVASMGAQAVAISENLRNAGYSTFICTQMDPGQDFRRQITANAANCKIMLILLDERWAKSKECLSEFNCAYSCYNKTQAPQIIPVVVGGFQWICPRTHPEVNCITANFQCLVKAETNTWEELNGTILQKVAALVAELKTPEDVVTKIASQNQAFMDFITCEICQSIFKDPKILPCSHSFCKNCLIGWKKSNGEGSFFCPKCRIPCSENIDNLKSDFRANQFIEAIASQEETLIAKTKHVQLLSQNADEKEAIQSWNCEPELAVWFKNNKIPESISQVLIDNGFEFLDVVLDMTEDDIKELGMKIGHAKKLLKSINDHKSSALSGSQNKKPIARPPSAVNKKREASNSTAPQLQNIEDVKNLLENWKLVDELYDERVLFSGTNPTDSMKFWASLTKMRWETIVDTIKKLGVALMDHLKTAKSIKAKCLQKVAMVLCDAGAYGDAIALGTSALTFESCSDREYEIKVLLIYATHNKLKQPMWVLDTKDTSGYKNLVELCKDVIQNQKNLSKAKLCKVHILKAFTLHSLVNRSRSLFQDCFPEAEADLEKAIALCQQEKLEGLRAEALMTRALLKGSVSRDDESRKALLEARKLCLKVYGEFSTLSARIYYNLGIDFEVKRERPKAYECFRRTWLIDRQVAGVHHPSCIKSGSVLTDDYSDIARDLKDSMPDTDEGPTAKDRDYTKRVKFLDEMAS